MVGTTWLLSLPWFLLLSLTLALPPVCVCCGGRVFYFNVALFFWTTPHLFLNARGAASGEQASPVAG